MERIRIITMALSLTTMVGCGREDSTSTAKDMSDQNESDMLETMPDMSDMTTLEQDAGDMPGCEPLTKCPQDRCGVLDDGCGGVLECTPCTCVDGSPQQPQCGLCGLGRARCEGDVLECDEPALPVSTLDCTAQILHVDASYEGFESGTSQEPFKSLSAALTQAKTARDVELIIMKQGSYTEAPLVWASGISLIGGYDEMWTYQPDQRTEILFSATDDQRHRGIYIANSLRPLTLAHLSLETEDAREGSLYTTPLEISGSENITITQIDTRAGRGVAGQDGESGMAGQDGADGVPAQMRGAGETGYVMPGTPGFPAMSCEDAVGGVGGEGGRSDRDGERGDAPQAPGAQPNMGAGGDGINFIMGQDGGPGLSYEQSADSGENATGLAEWSTQSGGLVWSHARDGQRGAPGTYGVGGTGGGGGAYRQHPGDGLFYDGGAGGGGGNGGCGGQGGEGGSGGGSSFGIVISESTNMTISKSSFESSNGGNGGDGGAGGRGGTGGRGSIGTQFPSNNAGGKGGDGGNGENGGAGGGGSGGYSIGMLCNAPISLDEVTFEAGAPGRGGRGQDDTAPTGITASQQGCQ